MPPNGFYIKFLFCYAGTLVIYSVYRPISSFNE